MVKLIVIYFILQTIYVILNTIKSILTIKSTKMVASISSAVCYAVYVFVLIYTVADFPIWVKALLTAITNFVGTWVSMRVLERIRKDKLWKIEATITDNYETICGLLNDKNISYNAVATNRPNEKVYNIYSKTKADSEIVKDILKDYNAKYIVYEETVRL